MGGILCLGSALCRSSCIRCTSLLTTTCAACPFTRSLCFTFTFAVDLVEIYQLDEGSLGIITYTGPQLNDAGVTARTAGYLRGNS